MPVKGWPHAVSRRVAVVSVQSSGRTAVSRAAGTELSPGRKSCSFFLSLQLISLALVLAGQNPLLRPWAGTRWGRPEGLPPAFCCAQIVVSEPQDSCKIWVANSGFFLMATHVVLLV